MADLKVMDLFDAMTRSIKEMFPDHDVYGEDVEQALTDGAFQCLFVSDNHRMRESRREHLPVVFEVLYYPKNGREEGMSVLDDLYRALKFITVREGVTLRGWDFTAGYTDGVVHTTIRYDAYVQPASDGSLMQMYTLLKEAT